MASAEAGAGPTATLDSAMPFQQSTRRSRMGKTLSEPVAAQAAAAIERSTASSRPGDDGACAGFGARDAELFQRGAHRDLYRVLGACPRGDDETDGARFAVWAPRARAVSVIGAFNDWRPGVDPLSRRDDDSGVWEGEVAAARPGELYKYRLDGEDGFCADRADPFARWCEAPPGTASRLDRKRYDWGDADWMQTRARRHAPDVPLAIYEVHLGSWRRAVLDTGESAFMGYRQLADLLGDHVAELGFTHVELLPVMEHPHYESLGFAPSALFAPSARFGAPDDLMALIDALHQRDIGVILDWPAFHFAADAGLARFDGEPLFEPVASASASGDGVGDLLPFDLGRPEVRAFLLSSAMFWLDHFHADGLRILGAPPALRQAAEAGDDRAAAGLIAELRAAIDEAHPDSLCITDESVAPPASAGSTHGGSPLALRWDRPHSRDTLDAFAEPQCAKRRGGLRIGLQDACCPQVLALSYDEVMARGSLLARMPGDDWQQRANLRLLLGWLYCCPGKKVLFMGTELAQYQDWQPQYSLDWHLQQQPAHRAMTTWVSDLNRLYTRSAPLSGDDSDDRAAVQMDVADGGDCVVAVLRQDESPGERLLAVFNLGSAPIRDCRIGVPGGGRWQEVLNSDAWMYGGSDRGNLGGREADPVPVGDQFSSLLLTLPPLAVLFLRHHEEQAAPSGGGGR
jgi:1,4-alpha-glucan branching enzyme